MDKTKKIIHEIHLYSNKMEYLIKFIIWVISWIGGIYILKNKSDGVSSAYFIFSLSLLMEFSPKIKEKKEEFLSRIIHSVFCFAMVGVVFISVALLLSQEYSPLCHSIMFKVTFFLLVYMGLDCLILWFSKETNDYKDNIPTSTETENGTVNINKFKESLMTGNLGNIKVR